MSRAIPNYLKLHVEELAAARAAQAPTKDPLSASFAAATGWQLPAARPDATRAKVARRHLSDLPVLEPVTPEASQASVELSLAQPLAKAINKLVVDLEQARRALEEREAELATAIPVTLPRDDSRPLLRKLEFLLKTAADSVQGSAAALYLLDDATSHLKLRAHHGLSPDRLFAPPRGLRGQAADLEALMGRTVSIPDTRSSTYTPTIPEKCGAAVCVPIASPAMPLGTLWVFAPTACDISALQVNMVEVVAGRITSELERHALCRETLQMGQMQRYWREASRWLRRRVPLHEPLADGWDISGWTPQLERLSGQFIDWELLADERLVVTMGRSPGLSLEAGLSAVTLQSITKALTPRLRCPRQLLTQVHQAAWRIAAGAPLGALAQAAINPESGDVAWAATGEITGIVVSLDSHRVLTRESAWIGESVETSFRRERLSMANGDTLVLIGADPKNTARGPLPQKSLTGRLGPFTQSPAIPPPPVRPSGFSLEVQELVDLVRTRAAEGVPRLIDGLRLASERAGDDNAEPAAILVVHRRSTP